MKRNLLFKTTNLRGFTLVETMASVFVMSMVIIGPLTLASSASAYAKMSKDMMIGNHLAQEAVELLRHQQDSVYIRCADKDTSTCPASASETSDEAAWRIFKERLGVSQSDLCFSSAGCSYDYVDMTTNQDANPTKYASTANSCNTLSFDPSTHTYVCTGVRGEGLSKTYFSRTVSVVSLTSASQEYDRNYSDDLRVTVTVTFKRVNGFTRSIKIVDFLHARA